ncbi:MAG: hypothetical protein K6G46_03530 [Prevotella sp.]|nr:hypothetical protein [Prevotella sp.]
MKYEIDPKDTSRAQAFELWMKSPMPMVTLTKTFDVTQSASTSCQSSFIDDAMVIGTSAMTATELDCILNQYTDQFCNPMVMWSRYRKGWLRTTLPISFQFHHVQMDGGHAARFLEELQKTINTI